MAKKNKNKNKGRANEDAEIQATVDAERTRDEARARERANEFYGEGSLGRLGEQPEVAGIGQAERLSSVSTEMAGGAQNIADAEKAYADSQVRDAYVQDALTRMQAGLGGFTDSEMQTYRAIGQRDINTGTATASRALRAQQAAAGVTGSSAVRDQQRLGREDRALRAQLGTNLMAQQIGERGRRLGEYSEFARGSAQDMAANRGAFLERLLGARANVADYTLRAQDQNRLIGQANVDNALNWGMANTGIAERNLARNREIALENLGRQERELAGRIGTFYGEQGADVARRGEVRGRRRAKEAMGIARRGVQ